MALRVTVSGDTASEQYTLPDDVSIGRDGDNTLVLAAPIVSRRHARLRFVGGIIHVADLGSGNGTTVDGRELEPRVDTPLGEGATFGVGPYTLSATWVAEPMGTVIVAPPGAEPAVAVATLVVSPVAPARAATPEVSAPGTVILHRSPRLLVTIGETSFVATLEKAVVTIGRDPTSDVRIDSPVISRYHMRLRRMSEGYQLEDVHGRNGVAVDGELFSVPQVLREGTTLEISGGVVVILYTEAAVAPQTPERAVRADLGGAAELVIGRDASSGLVIDHPAVSRRHARVIANAGIRVLEDLGSSNGTFINGALLPPGERRPISERDQIRIGPVALVLRGDELREQHDSRAISLDAIGLERQVDGNVNLLQQVSLAIRPHEFVAVVGVSGAGKSTLVAALSGLGPATKGTVWLNGTPLYQNWHAFRTALGFVPQDDILHKELTVARALYFSAALRLPSDTTSEERARRVDATLESLGLEDRRNVPIARLSGGQRKRVSIGAELLTQPGLFFLDEATSGLDPGIESQLMRLLRRLADEGRTVVLITHATKNVMLCDHVVFLTKGGYLAFFGPPDEALHHFAVDDFDGIYQSLEGELSPPEWAERYRQSAQYGTLVAGRLGEAARRAPGEASEGLVRGRNAGPRPISPLAQLFILTRRYIEIIAHDRLLVAILLLIAPIVGAIDLVSTNRDAFAADGGSTPKVMAFLFLTALFPFMIGALASVREIVKEDAIYRRERSVALGVAPYLASKVVVALLLALYHATALTAIKVLAVDIPGVSLAGFGALYLTIVLSVLSGVMFGLVISAFTRREEQAMMLAVAVIIVQIVFSGGLVSLRELGPAGTLLGGVTSTNWAFRAGTTATGLTLDGCSRDSLLSCELPGFASLEDESARRVTFDGVDEGWGDIFDTPILVSWAGMIAIMLVLGLALYALQRRKDTN